MVIPLTNKGASLCIHSRCKHFLEHTVCFLPPYLNNSTCGTECISPKLILKGRNTTLIAVYLKKIIMDLDCIKRHQTTGLADSARGGKEQPKARVSQISEASLPSSVKP